MIKHRESTLNRPPSCPKNGVHLYLFLGNVIGTVRKSSRPGSQLFFYRKRPIMGPFFSNRSPKRGFACCILEVWQSVFCDHCVFNLREDRSVKR